MFPRMLFEISRICGRIAAQFATVELFPVIQSFLVIFFCWNSFHLRWMLFMKLAARLEENWTQSNLGKLESVCCWKWELSSCWDGWVEDVKWDDQWDEITWTCWIRPKHEVGVKKLRSEDKFHKKVAQAVFYTTGDKKLSWLSGFWGEKMKPRNTYLPDKFPSRYGCNQIIPPLKWQRNSKVLGPTALTNVK